MLNISLKGTEFPLKIGITGGIGSGKSMVCTLFSILGIPFFEADKEARALYNNDCSLRDQLISLFGVELYTVTGELDRQKLAMIIFSDKEALRQVNELVHPRIREAFEKWHSCQTSVYVLYEAAILYEGGFYRMMDANILVTAPAEVRIRRVMDRDHVSREQVLARMKHQRDEEENNGWADFIINNSGSEFLMTQVLETDKKIRMYGKFC